MLKQSFTDFAFSMNTDGSGKAASCVRVLDMLACFKRLIGTEFDKPHTDN